MLFITLKATMANTGGPRNRKERRAAASNPITKASDIPLSQPSRHQPKSKSLFEIAAERQFQLKTGTPFAASTGNSSQPLITTTTINPDGTLSDTSPKNHHQVNDDPIGPFGQAIFFGLTLTMLHFTLDVLVHNQYRQEIGWDLILQRTLTAFPILVLLVYLLHRLNPESTSIWVQALFLGMSVGSGCYLIYSSNELAYFAVMQMAPPLGTLWVWSVIEMQLLVALSSLGAVGAYFWWGGYTIF